MKDIILHYKLNILCRIYFSSEESNLTHTLKDRLSYFLFVFVVLNAFRFLHDEGDKSQSRDMELVKLPSHIVFVHHQMDVGINNL